MNHSVARQAETTEQMVQKCFHSNVLRARQSIYTTPQIRSEALSGCNKMCCGDATVRRRIETRKHPSTSNLQLLLANEHRYAARAFLTYGALHPRGAPQHREGQHTQ